MIRRVISIAAAIAVSLFIVVAKGRADDVPPPVKLVIHPMAAPRPSLKYQLLPPFETRIRGNAAVYYGKVTAERQGLFGNRELLDKFEKWREMPIVDLRKAEVLETSGIEGMLARAARCESCDWQLPVHEEEYYTILLPEVQQSRQFARILATNARITIARGKFDQALGLFQSGFALARNVSAGETLVNDLVAVAVAGLMTEQLREFVQQPEAPNLYWAVAMLPHPLIDLREAVDAERNALASMIPEVRNLDARRTPDEWRQLLERLWQKAAAVGGDQDDIERADKLAAASLRGYPTAKQALLDRGMATDTVEAMPAAHVVFVNLVRTYEDHHDEIFQWMFLPYPEGAAHLRLPAPVKKEEGPEADPIDAMKRLLSPFAGPAYEAPFRVERDFALLRVVEALRLYGASHNGRLPEKLDEVTEVPLPDDPISGKPFVYRLNGATAIIELAPLPGRPTSWEITMER